MLIEVQTPSNAYLAQVSKTSALSGLCLRSRQRWNQQRRKDGDDGDHDQ